MSLQIECLAPLIPQNGHAAPPSMGVIVALTLNSAVFLTFSLDLTFAHLVPSSGKGGVFTPADTKDKFPFLSFGV